MCSSTLSAFSASPDSRSRSSRFGKSDMPRLYLMCLATNAIQASYHARMLRGLDPVVLVGEDHQLGVDAVRAQGLEQDQRLGDRHG